MDSQLIIFFDFETNGFAGSSVLEAALIKCRVSTDGEAMPLHVFHRYYHAAEPFNLRAFQVHGLSPDRIECYRRDQAAEYACFFKNDDDLSQFAYGCNRWVAHNIQFDAGFLPFPATHQFCTMKENTSILKLPRRNNQGYKYPTLKETALFYGLSYDESLAHSGIYDAALARDIFLAMLRQNHEGALHYLSGS
ncbi:MAG TPA: 3'-5' exonuclease [Firmicutes bacterium]|nr:3'-5' exonuclease [Bacillota bacterium]